MQVHVPSLPKRLQLSEGMIADLIADPVMAAAVLMGAHLDVFQRYRLRMKWWVPYVVDSSGFTSGKTEENFIYANLRALLIPDHEIGIYYPRFQTGKDTFWPKFYGYRQRHPLFRAQLGNEDIDKESGSEGAACFKMYYQNGNKLLMPAPDFMKKAAGQASLRFNTMIIEEYTQVDDSEKGRAAIDEQLSGRNTRASYNKNHPIWCNHMKFTAPARTKGHPSFRRPKAHEAEQRKGNVDYAHLQAICYKDYSDLPTPDGRSFKQFREDKVIHQRMKAMDSAAVLGDIFGVWAFNGKGLYTEEALNRCVRLAIEEGLEPLIEAAMN